MKCPKCGTENPEGSNFCQKCAINLNEPYLPPSKQKKSAKKYLPVIVIGVLVLALIGGIASLFSNDDKPTTEPVQNSEVGAPVLNENENSSSTEPTSEQTTEPTTEAATEPTTEPTTEKQTQKPTEKQTQKPTQKPTEKQTQKPTSPPKVNTGYVVNVNTGTVHRSNCQHVNENCVPIAANEIGNRKRCKTCNP